MAGDRRPRRVASDARGDAGAADGIPEPPPERSRSDAAARGTARTFVRASTRALAVDATSLYYGNSDGDGIYAIAKSGGEPVRLARRAPVAGGIALEADSLAWVASPGDAVLRVGLQGGGQPTTLRDRGIFSGVASAGRGVFITEAIGAGGALLRVTGATAARLATFEGAPRSVLADATHAYVITPTKVFRTPHVKGEFETIATGVAFASAQLDETHVYVVTEIDNVRVVARTPKTGGALTVVASDVRDAPIAIEGGEVLFFDASRPQVRAVATGGGEPRVIFRDDSMAAPTAIAADSTSVFVATGARESGVILTAPRR